MCRNYRHNRNLYGKATARFYSVGPALHGFIAILLRAAGSPQQGARYHSFTFQTQFSGLGCERREQTNKTWRCESGANTPGAHLVPGWQRTGSWHPHSGGHAPLQAPHLALGKRSTAEQQEPAELTLRPLAYGNNCHVGGGVIARTPPLLSLPLSFTRASSSSFRLSCQRGTSRCSA